MNGAGDTDFLLCEIGGTVGDIEGLPFFEAIRQLGNELGRRASTAFVHLTLVPYITSAGELKTKPTQHSVKELSGIGIQPDILLCRSDKPIPDEERKKIALFCNVKPARVIPARQSRHHLRRAHPLSRGRVRHPGARASSASHDAPAPDLSRWQQRGRARAQARRRGENRRRRQVHAGQGFLQIADRGADPRRPRQQRARRRANGSKPRSSSATTPPSIWKTCTASWCPAASASAARWARSRR